VAQVHGNRVRWVICGHSERRTLCDESDEAVARKVRHVMTSGQLGVILCVGETLVDRDNSHTMRTLQRQLEPVVRTLKEYGGGWERLVIAYEPVWAIGTGEVATPGDAQEVCGAIRELLRGRAGGVADDVRILYGGSVKVSNVAAIMAEPDVDGCLVGGASLDPDEFVGIVRYRLLAPAESGA
jgi:triosephosphate isomerase